MHSALCTSHCALCPSYLLDNHGEMNNFNAKTSLNLHFKVVLRSLGPFPKCAMVESCQHCLVCSSSRMRSSRMDTLLFLVLLLTHPHRSLAADNYGRTSISTDAWTDRQKVESHLFQTTFEILNQV